MNSENTQNTKERKKLDKTDVISRFVSVKLNREIVEGMISTYEFLLWQNKGSDEAKDCRKILNALKKSLL